MSSLYDVIRGRRCRREARVFFSREEFFLALGAAVLGAGVMLQPALGLERSGIRAMCIMAFAVLMWASEAVEPAVTAVAVIVLLPVMRVIPYEKAFEGLGSPIVWKVVGVFVMTLAVRKTGLDRRIAYRALQVAGDDPRRILFFTIVVSSLLVFVIPSPFGRSSLLSSVLAGLLAAVGVRPGTNLGKALFLSVAVTTLITSGTVIVGASSMMYSAGIFEELAGVRLSYFSWVKMNAPVTLLSCLLIYPAVARLFPLERTEGTHFRGFIDKQLAEMGALSRGERTVVALLILLGYLWTCEFSDSYPVEIAVALVLLMPFAGVLKWSEASKHISWGTIILLGAGLGLSAALKETGAAQWIVGKAFGNSISAHPVYLGLLVVLATVVLRLGMVNMVGVTATLLPVVLPLAVSFGLNPLWLGMLCALSSTTGFFLPSQGVTQGTTYGLGYFNTWDMIRLGAWALLIYVAVLVAGATLYWPLLGVASRI